MTLRPAVLDRHIVAFRAGAAVIAAAGTASTLAAKAATTSTPIVFSVATDPVAMGLVASLNRPGGNLTGVANLGVELGPKQLQLLHELVPAATIMAVLVNPDFPVAESQAQELHAAARKLGLEFHILHASSERDLDMIFVKMVEMRVGALAITADPFFLSRREQILTLATRHSLPAMSLVARGCRGGRLGELWNQRQRWISPSWTVCWPHSQGREAC
jgi:putative tryptophan/tyrosine transport system substrate-binding protein